VSWFLFQIFHVSCPYYLIQPLKLIQTHLLRNASSTPTNALIRNPFLRQLSHELLEAYHKDQLDAFGLYVYGLVLKSASFTGKGSLKAVLPPGSPPAHTILIQSLLQFPYNWSAWQDLADIAVSGSVYSSTVNGRSVELEEELSGHCHQKRIERDIEDYLQAELGGHFMYHFFCAHLQSERQAHSEALSIYERWMDPLLFQGSPYLLSQYAICSYHTRQFAAAKSLLEDLHNHMPYRLDNMDVYSNILYVQEDSVALSQLAHTAVLVDKYRAETCCIVGNYFSLKQQRAKAIQYFQRALKMDPSFTSAWTLMGHEFVEWKQTANAMQAYRRAVEVSPGDYRAWYGLGQTYELLNMNLYALYYYKQATQLRPYDARMWCAIGSAYASLQRNDDAIRAYERALEQDESEGIASQKLATLYRQQEGNEEKAASCYWRHLELRHLVTNATEKSSSSKHVSEPLEKLLQGISIESPEAEALLYLANYHRKNMEYDIAAV
jgi:anaphase-promoting complex subunit 8